MNNQTELGTNLEGRLKNTDLPYCNALLPVFEAVINSIQALEEANSPILNGRICVEVIRLEKTQDMFEATKRGKPANSEIIGFRITDNGIGFNNDNMKSFKTLDTQYKSNLSCRGVGRLLWLKAFKKVSIDSRFIDHDDILKRTSFLFSPKLGIQNLKNDPLTTGQPGTIVELLDMLPSYSKAIPKTTRTIAQSILSHCLWYFVRPGGCYDISVRDGDEKIDLCELFDANMAAASTRSQITLQGHLFDLTHIHVHSTSFFKAPTLALCAANRVVTEINLIGQIRGLHGKIADENGEFVYSCYVTSKYFDDHVRAERTSFNIPQAPTEMYSDIELDMESIFSEINKEISSKLDKYLLENIKTSRQRIDDFVSQRAPRYRPIISRIDTSLIDPKISDKNLELVLFKAMSEMESEVLERGHEILAPIEDESEESYRKKLEPYLRDVEKLKQSDLASYVSHRKVIIELLESAIKINKSTSKYSREDVIHDLIMPMGKTSDEVGVDSCNLWLIDERLAFHNYLASDKTLKSMPITENQETKEPDLLSLRVYDNPILISEGQRLPLASITVVEIKRPMRNDMSSGEEKDPIEQALSYLERVRLGNATTKEGRPIPKSDSIPGYCYVVCDLTATMQKRCKIASLTPSFDHSGYFGYNPEYKSYIEVISYERLINGAKERNRAFFDKLGLPSN